MLVLLQVLSTLVFSQAPAKPVLNPQLKSSIEAEKQTGAAEIKEKKESANKDVTGKVDNVKEQTETKKSEDAGLVLPWGKIGVVASVSLPRFLEIGIDSRLFKMFGFGFGFGPKMGTTVGSVELGVSHWVTYVNYHPFKGAFFLGLDFGSQEVSANIKKDLDNPTVGGAKIPTTTNFKISSTFFTPKLGWRGLWDFGLTVGTEFGYQLPMGSSSTLSTTIDGQPQSVQDTLTGTDDYKKAKADAEDMGKKIGSTAIPYWKILEVGWLL